eukprot:6186203-Pleurochrysis_carterae.AAC.6
MKRLLQNRPWAGDREQAAVRVPCFPPSVACPGAPLHLVLWPIAAMQPSVLTHAGSDGHTAG